MGTSKTANFNQEQNQIAGLFKALGHPARIAIVQHIASKNSCITGDIVNELPLAQATISQHLKALKEANIIQGTIDGTRVCYCLNTETWTLIKDLFNNFFTHTEQKFNCC